jgi:hypothetical protein
MASNVFVRAHFAARSLAFARLHELREFSVRHHKKPRQSRGNRDLLSDQTMFEEALLSDCRRHQRANDGQHRFDARADRKTLQLCRQVQHALMLALAGECGDELLRDVCVESVEPLGGAGQLLVRIAPSASSPSPAAAVMARLDARAAMLRTIVAQSICRKRAPALSFVVVPPLVAGGDHANF